MDQNLTKLEDMPEAFKKFPEMSALASEISQEGKAIHDTNNEAAGPDEIGDKYREIIKGPVEFLTSVLGGVSEKLDLTGMLGLDTAALLDNADENAKDTVDAGKIGGHGQEEVGFRHRV
ncbi:hypothetical protein ACWD7F_34155 [Streptomyces sp. NPDC005122]